jgi:thiamine-phosphate pyrophosphorylase
VTDRSRLAADESDALNAVVLQAGQAARAGVDLIQIREGGLSDRRLLELIGRCLEAARGSETAVIVNDRLDLALAAGAGGVHLKAGSMPAGRARELTPPGFLIGQSVHGVTDAITAADGGGLDYLVLGTIFESRSKPGRQALGPDVISEVARVVDRPILAIGGISLSNVADVAVRGASGVAAIGLFMPGSELTLVDVVGRLRHAFGR